MAQDYDYAQLIDDFELDADVLPGESLTDYIERRRREFENKADGGIIGIEVKIADEMAKGGRVGLVSGGALKGLVNLFKRKGDDAVEIAKQEEIFRKGPITTDFLNKVDDSIVSKFVRTRDAKGVGGYGLYDNFDDMPAGLKAAEIIKRFVDPKTGKINYDSAEFFIGRKLKGDETIDELIDIAISKPIGTGKGPIKDFEEYVLNPEKKADGGRVGLFMGGDPLTGQALSIYNSMSAYGFSDQEIANALQERGLYKPGGATTPVINTAPNIINQGGDGDSGGGGSKGGLGISRFDYGYTSPSGKFNIEDIGEGTIADEDYSLGMRLGDLGTGIKGGLAKAYQDLRKLPTPFNIASKAIGNISDFFKQKAEEKAKQELAAQLSAAQREINRMGYQDYGSGGGLDPSLNDPVTGEYTGASKQDYGSGEKDGGIIGYNKGGLATMFTRRR